MNAQMGIFKGRQKSTLPINIIVHSVWFLIIKKTFPIPNAVMGRFLSVELRGIEPRSRESIS